MATPAATLDKLFDELVSMNAKLDAIEDLLEAVVLRELPTRKVGRRTRDKIRKAIAEMKRGERVTLNELARA